jgi:hypothetical protein
LLAFDEGQPPFKDDLSLTHFKKKVQQASLPAVTLPLHRIKTLTQSIAQRCGAICKHTTY